MAKKSGEQKIVEKMVTFHFNPVSVVVTGTEEEILEAAKKAAVEQMQKQFPHFQYSISDPSVLTMEMSSPGMIVETAKDGHIGIVTSISKTKLNVTLTGNRDVSGEPIAFKKSTATFEDARSKRPDYMKGEWNEGDTAYIKVTGGEIREIVIGKKSGKKTRLWIVNGGGRYIDITEQQLMLLKEEKSEIK